MTLSALLLCLGNDGIPASPVSAYQFQCHAESTIVFRAHATLNPATGSQPSSLGLGLSSSRF